LGVRWEKKIIQFNIWTTIPTRAESFKVLSKIMLIKKNFKFMC